MAAGMVNIGTTYTVEQTVSSCKYIARPQEAILVLSSMGTGSDMLQQVKAFSEYEKIGNRELGIRGRHDAQIMKKLIMSLPNEMELSEVEKGMRLFLDKTKIGSFPYLLCVHRGEKDGIINRHVHINVFQRNFEKGNSNKERSFVQKQFVETIRGIYQGVFGFSKNAEARVRIPRKDFERYRETVTALKQSRIQEKELVSAIGVLKNTESKTKRVEQELPDSVLTRHNGDQIQKGPTTLPKEPIEVAKEQMPERMAVILAALPKWESGKEQGLLETIQKEVLFPGNRVHRVQLLVLVEKAVEEISKRVNKSFDELRGEINQEKMQPAAGAYLVLKGITNELKKIVSSLRESVRATHQGQEQAGIPGAIQEKELVPAIGELKNTESKTNRVEQELPESVLTRHNGDQIQKEPTTLPKEPIEVAKEKMPERMAVILAALPKWESGKEQGLLETIQKEVLFPGNRVHRVQLLVLVEKAVEEISKRVNKSYSDWRGEINKEKRQLAARAYTVLKEITNELKKIVSSLREGVRATHQGQEQAGIPGAIVEQPEVLKAPLIKSNKEAAAPSGSELPDKEPPTPAAAVKKQILIPVEEGRAFRKLKNDLLQLDSSIKDLGDDRERLKGQKVKQQRVLDSIVKERKTKITSLDWLKERVDKLQAQQKEYVSANLVMKVFISGYGKQVARELGKTEKTYNDQLQTIEREYEQAKLNCEKQILEITESVYRLQITQEQRQKQKAVCLSKIESQPLSVLGAVVSSEQKKS